MGAESRQTAGFVMITGHHIHLGKMVQFVLHGWPFRVLVHREGIEIEGKSPVMPVSAMGILSDVLKMAQVHFLHLASFQPGEVQTILESEEASKRAKETEFVVLDPQAGKKLEDFNRPKLVVVN